MSYWLEEGSWMKLCWNVKIEGCEMDGDETCRAMPGVVIYQEGSCCLADYIIPHP